MSLLNLSPAAWLEYFNFIQSISNQSLCHEHIDYSTKSWTFFKFHFIKPFTGLKYRSGLKKKKIEILKTVFSSPNPPLSHHHHLFIIYVYSLVQKIVLGKLHVFGIVSTDWAHQGFDPQLGVEPSYPIYRPRLGLSNGLIIIMDLLWGITFLDRVTPSLLLSYSLVTPSLHLYNNEPIWWSVAWPVYIGQLIELCVEESFDNNVLRREEAQKVW